VLSLHEAQGTLFDNTSHGVNADAALELSFRGVDAGVRQVYGAGRSKRTNA